MNASTFPIRRPCDFHTHLRSIAEIGKSAFKMVVRHNTAHYRYVVAEPNTHLDANDPKHHIETAEDVKRYRDQVLQVPNRNPHCTFLFLAKLTPRTTPRMVEQVLEAGAIGFKLYPDGVTTGSEHGGVSDFHTPQLYDCLHVLEERKAILQEHPELPRAFSMRREWEYGNVVRRHAEAFPTLRIFAEHLSDRRSLSLLELPNVYGTITGHHLRLTLDDVLGQSDHFCRPNAKEPEDRDALVEIALSGNKKVISITDSAYHSWSRKHLLACGCAGIFNPAAVAIPWLVTLWEQHGGATDAAKLVSLESFTTLNGCVAYNLEPPKQEDVIWLARTPWEVPRLYFPSTYIDEAATPFLAGETLPVKIVG